MQLTSPLELRKLCMSVHRIYASRERPSNENCLAFLIVLILQLIFTHMKKKINPIEMTAEKRQEEFLKVFRRFDSIGEGAEYIAQATGCVVGTVMVWRCKKKSGYGIPKRPFMMLMAAIEAKNAVPKRKLQKN